MAITQVGSTTTASTTNPDTDLVITKPTGVASGDVLIAGITSNDISQGVPSGWTAFDGNTLAPTYAWQVRLYYKVAGGSEGSNYTWTVGDLGPSSGFITAWRGVDNGNPIDSTNDAIVTANQAEPDTGPSTTAVSPIGRTCYIRAARRESAGGVSGAMSTATGGITTQASVAGVSGTGNTIYIIGAFSNNTDYSTTGSKSGLAISYSSTETNHYEATYNLRAAMFGPVAATTPAVTVAMAGHHRIDAELAATTPSVTASMEGLGGPIEGPIAATTPSATAAMSGNTTGGPLAATTPAASAAMTGSVEPIGPIAATVPLVTVQFISETRPIGEHIIKVEADHRAFRVPKDDGPLIPIKRSQVTQQ